MVTAKKTKAVVKKKATPIVLYHTPFGVMKVLIEMEWRGKSALWHYAGAIRGPDSESEIAKDISTAIIRGDTDYGNSIHMTATRAFPSEKMFDIIFSKEKPTGHFRRHANKGLHALSVYYRQIGNKRAANLFESMANALGTGDYKSYKKYVEKVVACWDFNRK